MAITAGTKIIEDGLILNIDPANEKAVQTGSLEVEYLIVAGGGGGGDDRGGGGGGAGGVITGSRFVSVQTHAVVIGAGGIGDTSQQGTGTNGQNSTAFGLTAIGGGGGGARDLNTPQNGGSGGGAGGGDDPSEGQTPGQSLQPSSTDGGFGNPGGKGSSNTAGDLGGGGGGAGAPGQDAVNGTSSGSGGNGLISNITGNNQYYAGGGAGQSNVGGHGTGGLGGGGGGTAQPGTANTGGGGGGGANGGSGVAIIRYKGAQQATGGDSVYQSGQYTVHVFNNSGNFVVGGAVGDVSGNSNGGAINGATYNAGNQGYYSFDGVDDYISSAFSFTAGQAVTIIGWLYSTANTSAYRNFMDTQSQKPMIWWDTNGKIEFDTGSGYRSSNVYRNQWVQVALVKPSGSSTASYYINGTFQAVGGTTYSVPASTPTWFNRAGSQTWIGNSSSVLVYNRALTATEINRNFQATRGRFGI